MLFLCLNLCFSALQLTNGLAKLFIFPGNKNPFLAD
jgi:hypothetical protein